MKSSRRGLVTLVCAALLVAGAAFAAQAGSGATGKKAAGGGSVTGWLSGTYAGATPGSTDRKWLDGIKGRYEKTYAGSKVTFVLTPINNAQFTPQDTSAFPPKPGP